MGSVFNADIQFRLFHESCFRPFRHHRPLWIHVAAPASSTVSLVSSPVREAGGDVPTIDISTVEAGGPEDVHLAAIQKACATWGFFKIVGHGVPNEYAAQVMGSARQFFTEPREVKLQAKRTADNARGWFDDELTKRVVDWKEGFDFGHKPAPHLPDDHPANRCNDGHNQWPPTLPLFRTEMERYYATMECLAARLTRLISRALGLPPAFFDSAFETHTSFLRLNHYPLCSTPELLGIGPHTDAGFLTILLADAVPSLQVQRDGQWVTVEPDPDAFVINIGDMCQVWSNDRFVAPVHRVLTNPTAERHSLAFFYNPNYSVDVAPIPGSGRPRYRPLNWGAFRQKRYEGDYADRGTEVQITDFAL